ncbi:MAG: DNA photolyase [Gammaproteobacteria bacterium]|nr:DNA photolyase [Gammaproteobacteria bacterium]
MFNRIYIENGIKTEPFVKQICEKFANANIVECNHYSEVFNKKAQNFRLQKQSPGLILAKKQNHFIKPAPPEYGIGGDINYYFSYMLNCIYDCRYCFLQGMYRSANYVLFINYEDFLKEIRKTCNNHTNKSCHMFSGYDCDSLAMEPLTGFMQFLLPQISDISNLLVELRTKSTQIRTLLDRPPQDNCVIAYSLLPDQLAKALDHKAPNIFRRLSAIRKLQDHGWKIGLRFDPLIYDSDMETIYEDFFSEIASQIDAKKIHSISIGTFRLPSSYFNTLAGYYPTDKLILSPLKNSNKMVSYEQDIKKKMLTYCYEQIHRHFDEKIIYPCETISE